MAISQNFLNVAARAPNRAFAAITSATGSSVFVTVFSGPANGTKVFNFAATATTTQAADVSWGILNTTSSFQLMSTVSVPANAGNLSSIATVNLFNLTNQPGLFSGVSGPGSFIWITSTADSLVVKSPVALVSGQIMLTAFSVDF